MQSLVSGNLLRGARLLAGLTQAELATRAGVAQSVISAYEAGRRQPALPTLIALVDATGCGLDVRLKPPLTQLTGPIGRRLQKHRRDVVVAAASHGITNLRLFGSVARGEDRSDSDVDLMADIPAGLGLIGLARATADLEWLLEARVDLVPADGIKPEVAARVVADLLVL